MPTINKSNTDFAFDAFEIKLQERVDDKGVKSSIMQAFPFGEYKHPRYGLIVMNQENAQRAAMNVNNQATTAQLYIDFDHKDGPAAGWVTGAEVDDNGLNLIVDWTEKGTAALKGDEYRYFSPNYARKWRHPKTGKVYENIILGGGLVNRPFLKDINPISLGEDMDIQALLKEVLGDSIADNVIDTISTSLSENINKEITSLKETFNEKFESQNKLIALLVEEKRSSDIELHVTKWSKILPVALHDPIRNVMKLADAETNKAFVSLVDEFVKLNITTLADPKQKSSSNPTKHKEGNTGDSAVGTNLTEEIEKLMKANPVLSFTEATTRVLNDNPSLLSEYRSEVGVG